MGDKTGIEWTDATWNPTIGCTRVSEGCRHCYFMAEHDRRHKAWKDGRYPASHPAPRQYHVPATTLQLMHDRLDQPLRWSRPRKIFVNSLSDLFHKDVTFEFVDLVFAVMAVAERHTFQILTKRPDRMREYVTTPGRRALVEAAVDKVSPGWAANILANWPTPNVWLGTSVENQKAADERIPALLETPAAVRFLSCEPLLGPVDLSGWAEKRSQKIDMPATWSKFAWPDWVPVEQRRQIENFWGDGSRRKPSEWNGDNIAQKTPAFGARVGVKNHWICKPEEPGCEATGRWVHAWNNMGRLITDEAKTIGTASPHGPGWLGRWLTESGVYLHRLHWVIAGGESGRGKDKQAPRPMHPDWARSLRDQCAAAGVPFLFKQWGEWSSTRDEDKPFGEFHGLDPALWVNGCLCEGGTETMYRIGKKNAGRLLDGVEHSEFPKQQDIGGPSTSLRMTEGAER